MEKLQHFNADIDFLNESMTYCHTVKTRFSPLITVFAGCGLYMDFYFNRAHSSRKSVLKTQFRILEVLGGKKGLYINCVIQIKRPRIEMDYSAASERELPVVGTTLR